MIDYRKYSERAFEGIYSTTMGGREEPLHEGVRRVLAGKQNRLPLEGGVLIELIDRILDLHKENNKLRGQLLEQGGGWGGEEVDTGAAEVVDLLPRNDIDAIYARLERLESK